MGRGKNGSNGADKVGLGTTRRPVIGLALGGGAARGFAHIGIVKTLVAHGIVPNVVVRASIGQTLIEDLPIKFATVATEVRTGHEIWLTHGRMVDAMRASYALPGIFSPVLIGDRWLVDGALVNPVPVSAARAFGAEIVIAANLSSDVFTHSTTRSEEHTSELQSQSNLVCRL